MTFITPILSEIHTLPNARLSERINDE